MKTVPSLPPVLIVGAGPTGMTAALDLAHYGIPSIIFDQDHKLSDGSRAIAFHHSALAIWEKLGASQAMLEKGIAWNTRHTYLGEKELYTQHFALDEPNLLPRFLNLQQFYIEQFLLDEINKNPLISIHWDHKIVGVEQSNDEAALNVETATGIKQYRGAYVLACDGARSAMRKLLNLPFPGSTFSDQFLIVDIKAELGFNNEPRFYFNHPAHPGPTVLIHPQPDGIWRIDWQIDTTTNIDSELSAEKMDERIRALIGDIPYEIVWISHYRFHQRLLDQFKHGRIFFAGDSAHLVAPFGARGLNSAVQDVENLVWKLAKVMQGQAPEALLDSYQTERWAAQKENQRVTIKTMQFMAPNSLLLSIRRYVILKLSGFWPRARTWVDSGKMSEPYTYTDSPLNFPDNEPASAWLDAPPLGARIKDMRIHIGVNGHNNKSFLRNLVGNEFLFIYFAKNVAESCDFVSKFAKLDFPVPAKFYPVMPTGTDTVPVTVIVDIRGEMIRTFDGQPGTLYLIRPDGHIAARRRKTLPDEWPGMVAKGCGF